MYYCDESNNTLLLNFDLLLSSLHTTQCWTINQILFRKKEFTAQVYIFIRLPPGFGAFRTVKRAHTYPILVAQFISPNLIEYVALLLLLCNFTLYFFVL